MKLYNIHTLKNKISKLICIIIIFNILCTPAWAVGANNANLTQLDLGEDFLFKADVNAAKHYFEIFNEFDAAINQSSFDFNKALQIATSNGMTHSGSIDNSINQGSGNVNYAVSQINTLFESRLSSVLSDNARNVISKVIQDTFNTHISSSNYIIYSSKSGSENSYLFKVLAGSVAISGNQSTLTLVPIEINVHVKVKVKKVLFVTVKKTKDYDVHIKAQSYKKTLTL
ncbi:toxin [Anaerobacterium chartisolvens]|uniref:Toxin n=1 Tax=Anaerobacterium chartisolvens TaxID=1297424 RepID=A0A369AFX0_9FIRM|nr:hypothetical protein [Anaerobacterium chartisolvens]RCX08081.1 toxin [Anaerobacterium chartisolvens]